jgi:hypothetical protein
MRTTKARGDRAPARVVRSRCPPHRKRGSQHHATGWKTLRARGWQQRRCGWHNSHAAGVDFDHKPQSEYQAGSDFSAPTFALPRNVTSSSTFSRGASMSPRSVEPAWSSQRSVTKILPSTVPRTFTDFVLISPHMSAYSSSVSAPVESIVPSTSPSISSSLRNLTEPLIETPRERRAPDGVGMNVRLHSPGTAEPAADAVLGLRRRFGTWPASRLVRHGSGGAKRDTD